MYEMLFMGDCEIKQSQRRQEHFIYLKGLICSMNREEVR